MAAVADRRRYYVREGRTLELRQRSGGPALFLVNHPDKCELVAASGLGRGQRHAALHFKHAGRSTLALKRCERIG